MACVAAAGPLDRSIVPADASWLVHIDVEAMRASAVGKTVLATARSDKRNPFEDIRRDFGLDPAIDIRGVTMFGWADTENDAVMILTTTAVADDMGDALEKRGRGQATVSMTEHSEFTIHEWQMRGRRFRAAVHEGRRIDDRLVVVSDSPAVVESGMKVISTQFGASVPTLMPNVNPMAGSMLFVTVSDLSQGRDQPPRAAILQASKSLVIDVGQSGRAADEAGVAGERIFGLATIRAADEASAGKVQQLVQGIMALFAVNANNDPEQQALVAQTLAGIRLSIHGDSCVVETSHDSETVAKLISLVASQRRRHQHGRGGDPKERDSRTEEMPGIEGTANNGGK